MCYLIPVTISVVLEFKYLSIIEFLIFCTGLVLGLLLISDLSHLWAWGSHSSCCEPIHWDNRLHLSTYLSVGRHVWHAAFGNVRHRCNTYVEHKLSNNWVSKGFQWILVEINDRYLALYSTIPKSMAWRQLKIQTQCWLTVQKYNKMAFPNLTLELECLESFQGNIPQCWQKQILSSSS